MKFKSEFFKDADELVAAKDDAERANNEKKERLNIVRKFSNGLATMTEEDAKRLGRKEIVNHLTTYAKLVQYESMYHSAFTGTKSLAKIVVKTGDPEKDFVTGQVMANTINKGAINRRGKFAAFGRKVAGEITISGGVPVVNSPHYGWLPEVSLDLIFPPGTELDAEKVTYAFEPKEYSYADLTKILKATQGRDDSSVYDIQSIRALIATLKQQIKDRTKHGTNFSDNQVTQPVRSSENSSRKNDRVNAWAYYEVKFREDGTQYVSKTVFVDAMQVVSLDNPEKPVNARKDDDSSARFILYQDEAFKDAAEWLHMVMVDAEISGVKTVDSLRGVAELMYPSAAEMEDLINVLLEGDKMRAKPKLQVTNTANKDDVAKWNIETDTFAPDGLVELEMKSNAQHLQTPIAMLDRTSSGLTGSPVSNASSQGGELRVQQQERQQANGGVQLNRLSEFYNCLDSILETVVWRLLGGEIKPGTDGYLETMWVRKTLKEKGIDYEKLCEREHGQFKWIEVSATRVIGNGDPQKQSEVADWMMANLNSVEPASRPILLQRAFAIKTGDLDLAEVAIRVPEVILNQQRLIAENEFDTICRRAAIGMTISPQPDDIHHNHVQSHLVDAQALLGKHEIIPWNMLDAISFGAVMQHIGEHLRILISNPATNFEGNQFLPAYQSLIHAAKPAIKAVQEAQQTSANQLTPKEQADIEIQVAKLEQKAHEIGIRQGEYANLERMRAEKQAMARRSQFVKEIESANRLELEKKKLEQTPPPAKASE